MQTENPYPAPAPLVLADQCARAAWINHIDDELMDLLGQRMRIAERIGEYKRNNGVTILQSNRWNQILEKSFGKGDRLGLSREFITRYLDAVHLESINRQNRVMNG